MGIDLVDAAWMGEHIEGCARSASNGNFAAALQEMYLCGNIYLGRNRWHIFGSEIGRGPVSLMVYSLLHFLICNIIPDANSQTSPRLVNKTRGSSGKVLGFLIPGASVC